MFCASGAFATDLSTVLASTTLSHGVHGVYFANNVSGDDATAFQIATAHDQGTSAFATANFVSEIYVKKFASDKYASSDLPTEYTAYTSNVYTDDSWTTK